jgi:glucose/arabinose dehydrogenase
LSADGDPATLGEIYAYGFRNAHRLSWDPADGTMFAFDIGMSNLEEDHDEGVAISGGFAYNGAIPALRGKVVFGDVNRGRIFAADTAAMKAADDGIPGTVAPIEGRAA